MCHVLEPDRPSSNPSFSSNWLCDVCGARHLAYLGLSFAFCKAEIIIISTWTVVVIKWDPMCTLLNTGMRIQQLVDTIISELAWELGSQWLMIFYKKARARGTLRGRSGSLQRKVSGCSHWKLPRFSPPALKVPLLASPCPKAQPDPSGFCQSHPPVLFHSARWSPPSPPQYWHKKDKILQLFAKGIWQCFSFSLQHSCWTDGKQVSMILFLIWQNHVSSNSVTRATSYHLSRQPIRSAGCLWRSVSQNVATDSSLPSHTGTLCSK